MNKRVINQPINYEKMENSKYFVNEIDIVLTSTTIEIDEKFSISTPEDVVNILRKFWKKDIKVQESLYCVYLNRAHTIQGIQLVSIGGIHGTIIDNRLILAPALKLLSSAIIIAHNHPSSSLKASNEDNKITNKLKEAAKLFDIELLDSLILTKDSFVSIV